MKKAADSSSNKGQSEDGRVFLRMERAAGSFSDITDNSIVRTEQVADSSSDKEHPSHMQGELIKRAANSSCLQPRMSCS